MPCAEIDTKPPECEAQESKGGGGGGGGGPRHARARFAVCRASSLPLASESSQLAMRAVSWISSQTLPADAGRGKFELRIIRHKLQTESDVDGHM